jgi:tRNA threonylcarbamoyladenosine biosynthesis protein TsaB
MPSLRHILAAQVPVVLLDTASSRGQVAWLTSPDLATARWATSEEETGVGLFRALDSLGIDVNAAAAFIFCDGPGSVLGIRTAAMALRTWNVLKPRPVFTYCSLALVAHALARPGVGVIADARRDAWHHYTIGGKLRRLPAAELAGELVTPARFRHWSTPPAGIQTVPYDLADLLPRVLEADLLRPTDAPDAFLHEEPSYVTWTPQIHRAPVP